MEGFHKPIHPLPIEVQEMPRNEVVCHYCGVSYLIHHEIKKLEAEIARLNKELKANDVTFLKKSNEKLTSLFRKLEAQNSEYIQTFETIKLDIQKTNAEKDNRLKELQSSNNALKREKNCLQQEMKKQADLYQQRCSGLEERTQRAEKELGEMKGYLLDATSHLEEAKEALERGEKERVEQEARCEELERQNKWISVSEGQIRKDLEAKLNECQHLESDQAHLMEEVAKIQKQVSKYKERLIVEESAMACKVECARSELRRKDEELSKYTVDLKAIQVQMRNTISELNNWKEKYTVTNRDCSQAKKEAADLRLEVHHLREDLDKTKVQRKASELESRNIRAEMSRFRKDLAEAQSAVEENKKSEADDRKLKHTLQRKVKDLEQELHRVKRKADAEKLHREEIQAEKDEMEARYKAENNILHERLQGSLQLTEVEKHASELAWKRRWQEYRTGLESQMEEVDRQMEVTRRQSVHSVVKERRLLEENEVLKKQVTSLETELSSAKEESAVVMRLTKERLETLQKELHVQMRLREAELKERTEEITILQETVRMEVTERESLQRKMEDLQNRLSATSLCPDSPDESSTSLTTCRLERRASCRILEEPPDPRYPHTKTQTKATKSDMYVSHYSISPQPSKQTSQESMVRPPVPPMPPAEVLEFIVGKGRKPDRSTRVKKTKRGT